MSNARNIDPDVGGSVATDLGPRPKVLEQGDDAFADLSQPLILEKDVVVVEEAAPPAARIKRRASKQDLDRAKAEVFGGAPHEKPAKPQKNTLERLARTLLILTAFGLLAFIAGALLAYSVLSGAIDLHSPWVKELTKTLKDLADIAKGMGS